MLFESSIVLALAASAAARAHPRRQGHDHFHHRPSGSAGWMKPTGGPFPANGTDGWGGYPGASGSGAAPSSFAAPTAASSAAAVSTVTVVPLPASSDAGAASVSSAAPMPSDAAPSLSSAAAINNAASSAPADTGDDWGTCTESSTITTTFTNMFTVTVTPGAPSSGAAPASSDAGATGIGASPSTSVAALSAASSASSLVASSSAAGGQFFQHPSAQPFQGSSAASAIPTTFATSAAPSVASAMSSAIASAYSAASSAGASGWGSSVSSSAASPSSTGGSTGGKRGLSYNTASLTDAFSGDGMTWAYNWAAVQGGTLAAGLEYVPLLWGLAAEGGWAAAAQTAASAGSKHFLSFNEPDLSSQSNIDPATAATNHIQYMNPVSTLGEIGSPAVTNGAGTSPPMGIDWLNAFFTSCGGKCTVDFVAFHWYDDASNFAYFQQYVTDVINAAAAQGISKVWLTEFGATGSDSAVESFLQQALPWLDSQPAVERYAYFMCGTAAGQLVSGTSTSDIGQVYASTS